MEQVIHIAPKIVSVSLVIQIFLFSTYAQQNKSSGDVNPLSALFEREMNFDYNPALIHDLDTDHLKLDKLLKKNILPDMPLQFDIPANHIWHKPTNHIFNLSNGILNSNFNSISYPLLDKNAFYVSGAQELMPGISSMNSMMAGFMIQPTDNWIIDISSSVLKYRDMIGVHNDLTMNASSYLSLSDNWSINLYGGYSLFGNNNVIDGVDMNSPFAPKSYFGGSVEYKFSDRFSIEAGMKREFNPWLKRWENVYYVTPKFKLNDK